MSFEYLDNRDAPCGGCCREVEPRRVSGVCRILSSGIEPILQFLLVDLKPNPARSTCTTHSNFSGQFATF